MTTHCLHCGLGESFYRRESSSIHFSRVRLPLALGKSVSVCLFAFTCWVFIFVNFNLAQFNLFTLATRKETVTQGGGSECESQLVDVHCGGHNRLTSPLLAMASFPLLQLFASLIKEPQGAIQANSGQHDSPQLTRKLSPPFYLCHVDGMVRPHAS